VLSLCAGQQIEQYKKITIKYVMAIDGHVTMIFHMQQPTKMRAGVTRGERAGGMKPSFWGALEVERGKKTTIKLLSELVHFFLGR
jgi:hypothetical protein